MKTLNSVIFACFALIGTSVNASETNEVIVGKGTSELVKIVKSQLDLSMKESLNSIMIKNNKLMKFSIDKALESHVEFKAYKIARRESEEPKFVLAM